MKRSTVIATAVVGASIVAAAAWFVPHMAADKAEPRPEPTAAAASNGNTLRFPAGAPQLAFLKVQSVELAPEPLVEALPGRLAYDENHTARVSPSIGGRVIEIHVELGARVVRGAPLAVLDAPDYSQALADLERDELEVKQKRQVHERTRRLFDGGVIARKEVEAAETDLREAEVERGRAQRRLHALGQNGTERNGQFVLRAPIAGVVTERSINPGTLVGPDTGKPLFVISDPARLRVVVDVPEQRIGVLHAGQAAVIEVDAFPGRSFPARITHVGEVLDATTRRVQVLGEVDNTERALKPEMYTRVTPLASNAPSRVRVPNGAIVTAGVTAYVFTERGPGVFERRAIVVATQGREFTYLKDGLAANDRVVVSGALLLESELQAN